MPSIGKADERGDLYASAEIQLPRTLTKEQRQHYEALAKLEKSQS
jgi:DnaJ-class molecular chaperone